MPWDTGQRRAAAGLPPLIHVDQLSKRFGDRQILDGVSFSVQPGETLVVLGRSGTGKSVLLKNIIGLMSPDGGRATVDGACLHEGNERRRLKLRAKLGYVFQFGALFDSMPVWENVGFPLLQKRRPLPAVRARALERLRLVGLEHTIDQYPAQLSGGMQKRVSLARALIELPKVVLYDEPTSGLDPLTTDVINQIILRLASALHVTSIVVTHDIKSAMTIADRIIMLDKGKIVAQGTPASIQASENIWVQHFIRGEALASETIVNSAFRPPGESTKARRSRLTAVRTKRVRKPGHDTSSDERPGAQR